MKLATENFKISGVLSNSDIDEYKKSGYQIFVDFRLPQENIKPQQDYIISNNLKFYHIPVAGGALSPDDVDLLDEIITNHPNDKIVMFCGSGCRVAAVLGLLQIKHGTPIKEALDFAYQNGMYQQLSDSFLNCAHKLQS